MRVFAIKRTGKSILQNMIFDNEITLPNEDKCLVGLLFVRKKDAKKYLDTFQYKVFYEVIALTVDKSNKDNRVS